MENTNKRKSKTFTSISKTSANEKDKGQIIHLMISLLYYLYQKDSQQVVKTLNNGGKQTYDTTYLSK